ncbi:MAG: hypothetical protein ACRDPO_31650 [Streptosporangiaceae bacterium]
MPNVELASKGTLAKVWVNKQQQVALVFDGGKITVMMWPATYTDPARWFRYVAAKIGPDAFVGHVHGQPAVIVRRSKIQPNPTWIEFYRNGTDINVVSASYDARALISIAGSIMSGGH